MTSILNDPEFPLFKGRKPRGNNKAPTTRPRHCINAENAISAEKTSIQKFLTRDKKGRHAAFVLVPHENLNITRSAAINAPHTTSFSNLIDRIIASAVIPKVGTPQLNSTVSSSMYWNATVGGATSLLQGNYGNPLLQAITRRETGDAKVEVENVQAPFFATFTHPDAAVFTYVSSFQQGYAKPFPTLQFPEVKTEVVSDFVVQVSTFSDCSGCSILDVLPERSDIDTSEIASKYVRDTEPSKCTCPVSILNSTEELGEPQFIAAPHLVYNDQLVVDIQQHTPPKLPENTSSLRPVLFEADIGNYELLELDQSELDQAIQQDGFSLADPIFDNAELVVHHIGKPTTKSIKSRSTMRPWHTERIFFASIDGEIRLVNPTQTIYDVTVMIDDDASDYSSVAQPAKSIASPAKFDSPLKHSQKTYQVASPNKPYNLRSSERVFFAAPDGYTRVVDLAQTMYDVDIITEDSASDFDSIYSPVKSTASPPNSSSPLKFHTKPDTFEENNDECIDVDGLFDYFSTIALGSIEGADTPDTLLSFEDDEDAIDPCLIFISKQVKMVAVPRDDETVAENSSALLVSSLSDPKKQELKYDPMLEIEDDQLLGTETKSTLQSSSPEAASPYHPLSTAWTSEITRTTLGTESLFTLLSHLPANDNGSTTKPAIAGTFLKLVNLEREKLSEHRLPVFLTVDAIISSKIIPRTIFLGTTSLAAFLTHFDDETTADEVYRVFSMLGKVDMRFRTVATTGLMGALGCRLNKLVA